jgi:hypothetical protein
MPLLQHELPVEDMQFAYDLIGLDVVTVTAKIVGKYPVEVADIGLKEDGEGNRFRVRINVYTLTNGVEICANFREDKLWRIVFAGTAKPKFFITDTYEFGEKEVKIEK